VICYDCMSDRTEKHYKNIISLQFFSNSADKWNIAACQCERCYDHCM